MRSVPIVVFILTGCGVDTAPTSVIDDTPDEDVPLVVDDQSPPVSHAELVPWLADGAYQTWACEAEAHPARPPGAHRVNRICSNQLLSQTADGRYPVGAASVKELVTDGQVTGYAVMRKIVDTGQGNDWFWYEAYGDNVLAEGRSIGGCIGCHSQARDHIFTRVE
jgi:hypothetical protein